MGDNTAIQWTTHTFNPWIGCSKVSPACENCYAEVETFPRVQRSRGLELWGQKAERHITSAANWRKPHRWNLDAIAAGERHRVFCASLADIADFPRDPAVSEKLRGARERLWALIEDCPQLDWLLLTKRPENLRNVLPVAWLAEPRKNVWLGTTAEDQRYFDERAKWLREVPAAVHFFSIEPQLGHIDLGEHTAWIDWVINGGESGSHARPFHIEWADELRLECERTGIAYFLKQLGARPFADGHPLNLRHEKGGDMSEWYEWLRVREFPRGATP